MLESEVCPRGLRKVLQSQSPERHPKIRTIKRINKRIYRRIDPPQPRQVPHQHRIALRQERSQQIVHEERQPARDEPSDHDAEGLRRLRLPSEGRNPRGRFVVEDGHVQAEGLRSGAVVRRQGRRPVEAAGPMGRQGGVRGEGVVEVRAEGARAVARTPDTVRGVVVVLAEGLHRGTAGN